ncbi:MAG: hypothetical protein ACRELW_05550 [Candidatus Rokuibacteriota bacterium]
MRRVMAVVVALLTAGWPFLLPPPALANPCANNAHNNTGVAQAGHTVDQSGAQTNFQANLAPVDQSGHAGAGGSGFGGTGFGGTGFGGPGGPGGAGGSPSGGGVFNVNAGAADAAAGPAIAAAANVGVGGGTQGPSNRQASTSAAQTNPLLSAATASGSPSASGQNGPVGGATAFGNPDAGGANGAAAAAAAPGANTSQPIGGSATSFGGPGGFGGTGFGGTGFGGSGFGGSGGSNAARTAGPSSVSAGSLSKTAHVAPAIASVAFNAIGDPCAQNIINSNGIVAVNGVNTIKNSVLQASSALIGNAANTAWNQPKLNLGTFPLLTGGGGGLNINPNLNFNANTNGNTTSVNVGISR